MKNEIIEQAIKYGTFEFKDQYIADETKKIMLEQKLSEEEAKQKALKKYQEDFCGGKSKDTDYDYFYNFYILNYPVIYLTNIYTQFFFTNIPFK